MDSDMDTFSKPSGRASISAKPLGVSNCISAFERKSGFYGPLFNSSPGGGVRKSLFLSTNKENEDSALCKDFFSNKEVTGKTPIAVPNKPKAGTSSDEAKEGRRMKPRRSMLGLRSKKFPAFTKDDGSFTISKPLHSSSPVNVESSGRTNFRLQKATSTPTLNHPFDSEDADGSSFFSKGLSDSAWSVFRPTKAVDKKQTVSNNLPTETPLSRGGPARCLPGENKSNKGKDLYCNEKEMSSKDTKSRISSNKSSVRTVEQKRKLQWLALKFQENDSQSGNSPPNGGYFQNKVASFQNRYSEKGSKMKEEMESNILGARTRGQLKKEKEKCLSDPVSPIRKEIIDDLEVGSRDSSHVDTLDDSTDSYVQNEATIVGTCVKKLPNINEESLEKMTISPMIKLREEAQDDECSDEYLSSEEQEEAQDPQAPLINLISQLEKEKEEINSKLTDLLHRQQSFDAKWNQLNQALNSYFDNVNNASKKKSKAPLKKPKHFKVICTKARRSIMSPSASLALSKSSKTEFKNFGDLKENFSCLKTPNQSVKKVRRLKKSVCYTPNSLSVLVGDQVKDIFGEM